MVGERVGRLLVLSSTTSKHNKARWICQCDCGKTCIATGASLRNGKKKSCGCLAKETSLEKLRLINERGVRKLPPGESAKSLLYYTYKWQANKRNKEFQLSKEEFYNLTSGNCTYCGAPPSQVFNNHNNLETSYIYNGIDRQNNSKGYTLDNCVSCCGVCNDMKRARSVTDFVKACEKVVSYYNYKKSAEMTGS